MKTIVEFNAYAFPIKLEQHENGRFKVTYGKQALGNMRYTDAAHELGTCIFHALACEGKIDEN